MNGADSEPRRQLPTTAAREMTASQPKWRQLCVEYGGLLEIVFFAIKVTFAGYQFMTDFYSQNRCVCSTRSHGPLLCAFSLSFHFKLYSYTDIMISELSSAVPTSWYKDKCFIHVPMMVDKLKRLFRWRNGNFGDNTSRWRRSDITIYQHSGNERGDKLL